MDNVPRIEFSRNDLRRKITIPNRLTPELAEDIGFHIGDGYMKNRISKGIVHYDFAYSGNYPDDLPYFRDILIPRKRALFNFDNMKIKKQKSNSIVLKLQSKAVFLFYKNNLSIQESLKTDIEIPKWIFSSIDFQKAILRGLIDSDGSFRIVKKGRYKKWKVGQAGIEPAISAL